MQHGHQRRAAGAGRRTVDLAGLDDAGIAAGEAAVDRFEFAGEEGKGEVPPVRQIGVGEAQLLVAGLDDLAANDSEIAASSGRMSKPRDLALAMTKLSPP
jgi:hypothetical protein